MWNWNALSQQATTQNAQAAAPASPQQQQAPQLLYNRPAAASSVQIQSQAPAATTRGAPLPTNGSAMHDKQPAAKSSTATTAALAVARANASASATGSTKDVEKFSGLRIANRTISAQDVQLELSERKFIALKRIDAVPKDTFTSETVLDTWLLYYPALL